MIGSRRKRRRQRGQGRKNKPKAPRNSASMLPPGFKKDSRVWLHKNPKSRAEDVDKSAVLRRFLDSEKSFNENSQCYFMEYQGKQFKKDSRSWLHKSSLKKQQGGRSRRKGPGPVAGDGCREPELARSNTDVRLSFQQQDKLLKRKSATFHASDGDIISNDTGLRQVLRKKRVDNTAHGAGQQVYRRPVRTLSEERLNDEVNTIMTYASLNTFGHYHDQERMTELSDDPVGSSSSGTTTTITTMVQPSTDYEENSNQQAQPTAATGFHNHHHNDHHHHHHPHYNSTQEDPTTTTTTTTSTAAVIVPHIHDNKDGPGGGVDGMTVGFPVQSYPSLLSSNVWRDTVAIKSDTSSGSAHSKASMDTLAPGSQDLYNANDKGRDMCLSPDRLSAAVTDKLRSCQSDSRSSVGSLGEEHAQLKMMSLCASPPGSLCSGGSISEEDLKSSDVDI